MKKLKIFNVGISALTYELALEKIKSWIQSKDRQYVCVSAVHLLMECQEDKALREGVNKSGMVTSDGMPLVWLLKIMGKYNWAERVYGPDLTLKLCQLAQKKGYKIFLLGGSKGESVNLSKKLMIKFPRLKIVGTADTPIRPIPSDENKKIVEKINKLKAQILFVGMGCPWQEKWMIENIENTKVNVMIGVGAAFDFITGKEKQAPKWMQKMGMEWFYRLCHNPKRLWHRYLVLNSKFILKLIKSLVA